MKILSEEKNNTSFPYHSHSDFELYGIPLDLDNTNPKDIYSKHFYKLFGGQEIYPNIKTKGLANLPPNLFKDEHKVCIFGDIAIKLPPLKNHSKFYF